MKPTDTGHLYDRIATWWNAQEPELTSGIHFVQRAIKHCRKRENALDIGCGGGRMITVLTNAGFQVTGIDVSEGMLEYARKRHADVEFIHADICEWQPRQRYDAVIAWDSIFHVPHTAQGAVVARLCDTVVAGGVVLFTAGGVDGEITGQMCEQDFYYSSLAEEEYLRIMQERGCKCVLMERDQYPEEHVVFIGVKGSV